MTPDEYCQDKAARSGSSFYYAFLFLPPARRLAITSLYAFCREVDDVVDECTDVGIARTKLAWWRTQVAQMYQANPTHPVTRALQPHLEAFDITETRLQAIITGMEMDLDHSRYSQWADLERYCWHAAGVVGELSAGIFGYQHAQTLTYASKLGLAFQLTNIIRDVGDDARRGRIYLPLQDLQKFNVDPNDLLAGRYSPEFTKLMQYQATRARELYGEAAQHLDERDRRSQRPGLMMAAIYATLLAEIEQDGWQVLDRRIALTPIRKLWLAWRNWVGGGRPALKLLHRTRGVQQP
jgi:phytoene synthase